MASKALIGLILSLTLSLPSWATNVIKLNPTHPHSYIVVKGDTLWDISAKFLQDPWRWPNIWHHNEQIKNPHLIYPGDVISLCFIDKQPRLCVNSPTDNESILYPHIRTEGINQAIEMIPTEAIKPYLSSPKIVSKDELANAPYIIGFSGEQIIAAAGDQIYVRSILKPKYIAYTTYRPGDTYTDPETNEILGYEATYIADNVIIELGDPATLRITNTEKEVLRGDRLMPTSSEEEVAFNFFPTPPTESINGSIIAVLNGVQEIGQYDIIVISKGRREGLKRGHLLSIIQKGKIVRDPYHKNKNELVKLPDKDAGLALVFRAFDRVSYALVMSASKNIRVLDKVQTPEK